jgi:SAM-dependent methyltransferase
MHRHATTTDILERSERAWWAEHAEVEDRWCWVQTPRVQHLLRDRYTRRIAGWVRPGDTVVEVGCGTGWLTILLAEAGVHDLVGIDFSPEQVERARQAAAAAGADVTFAVGGIEDLAALGRPVDVVVLHAFLHHLAVDEIDDVFTKVGAALAPGGRLVVLEPTWYEGAPAGHGLADRVLRRVERLPMGLAQRHLRRVGDEERATRDAIGQRGVGEWPFGPSPKELPFTPDELAGLLQRAGFTVLDRSPELSRAQLVAQELLLAGLSQPRLWRVALGPLLRLAVACDRRAVRRPVPPGDSWVFELYLCGRAAAPA